MGRPLHRILAAPLRRRHRGGIVRVIRDVDAPGDFLARYVLGRGEYPWRCTVASPTGPVTLTAWSSEDVLTINEVFCRRDYARPGPAPRTVVDIGANVGISVAWFLAQDPAARVWAFEPVPRNVDRLRENLAPFAGRWSLQEVAVTGADGESAFGTDPGGRHGSTIRPDGERLTVATVSADRVLREILEERGRIDLLKVDVEGTELDLLGAISGEVLDRIEAVVYEWLAPCAIHTDRFGHRADDAVNWLERSG